MGVENIDQSIDTKQSEIDKQVLSLNIRNHQVVFNKIDKFQDTFKNIISDEGKQRFNEGKQQIDKYLSSALNDLLVKDRMLEAKNILQPYFNNLVQTIDDYRLSLDQILEVEREENGFSNSMLEFRNGYSSYLLGVSKGGAPDGSSLLDNGSELIEKNAKLLQLINKSRNLPQSFKDRVEKFAKDSMEKIKEVMVALKVGEIVKGYSKYLNISLSFTPRVELKAEIKKNLILMEDSEFNELSKKNDDASKKKLANAIPTSIGTQIAVDLGGKNTDLLIKSMKKEVEDEVIEKTDIRFAKFFAGKMLLSKGNEEGGVILLKEFLEQDLKNIDGNNEKKAEYEKEATELISKIESIKNKNNEFFKGKQLLESGDIYGAKCKLLKYLNNFNLALSQKGEKKEEVEKNFSFVESAKDLLKKIAKMQIKQLIDRAESKKPRQLIFVQKKYGAGDFHSETIENPEYSKYEKYIELLESINASIEKGEVLDFNEAVSKLSNDQKTIIETQQGDWNTYAVDKKEDEAAKTDNIEARKTSWLELARKYREEKNYELAEEFFKKYFAERLNKSMKEDKEVSLESIKGRYFIRLNAAARDKARKAKEEWDAKAKADPMWAKENPWDEGGVINAFIDAAAKEMMPREVLRYQQIKLNGNPSLMKGEELNAWNEFASMKGVHGKDNYWESLAFSDQEIDNLVKELPIQVGIIAISGALSGGVGGAAAAAIMRQGAIRAGGTLLADQLLAFGVASGTRRLAAWGTGLLIENTLFTASTTVIGALRTGQLETQHLGEEWAKGLLTLGGLNLIGRATRGLGIGEEVVGAGIGRRALGLTTGGAAAIGIEVAGMANLDILAEALKSGNFQGQELSHTLAMVLGLKVAHAIPNAPKAIKRVNENFNERKKTEVMEKKLRCKIDDTNIDKISFGENGQVLFDGKPTELNAKDLPKRVLVEAIKNIDARKLGKLKQEFGENFEKEVNDGGVFYVDENGVIFNSKVKTKFTIDDLPSELQKILINKAIAESIGNDSFGMSLGREGGITKEGRIIFNEKFFNDGKVEIFDRKTNERKTVKILPNGYEIRQGANGPEVVQYKLNSEGNKISAEPIEVMTLEAYRNKVKGTIEGDALDVAMYRVKQHEVHHRLLNYAKKLLVDEVPFEDALIAHFERNPHLAKKLGIQKGKDGKFKYEEIEERLAKLSDWSDSSIDQGSRQVAEGILKNFFGKVGIDYSVAEAIKIDKTLLTRAAQRGVNYGERSAEAAKGGSNSSVENKSEKNKNESSPEKMKRNPEVIAVGDLHGNAEILLLNLKHLGVINANANLNDLSSIRWLGGNRKVVFLGDILADRGTQSVEAFQVIDRLSAQAREKGGEVSLIAGNHEDFATSFLSGRELGQGELFSAISIGDQAVGIIELINKFSKDSKLKNFDSVMELLLSLNGRPIKDIQRSLLNDMLSDPRGKLILEQMARMKVVEVIDGVLYTHTNLTPEILMRLNRPGKTISETIDEINAIYQKGLRISLGLETGQIPAEFDQIRAIFLDTAAGRRYQLSDKSRRRDLNELSPQEQASLVAPLKEQGIKSNIHGHDDAGGKVENFSGLQSVSVDYGAGKRGKGMDRRSIGVVSKGGEISIGLDAKIGSDNGKVIEVINSFTSVLNRLLAGYDQTSNSAKRIIKSFNDAIKEFWEKIKNGIDDSTILAVFKGLFNKKLKENNVDDDTRKIFENMKPLNDAQLGQTMLFRMDVPASQRQEANKAQSSKKNTETNKNDGNNGDASLNKKISKLKGFIDQIVNGAPKAYQDRIRIEAEKLANEVAKVAKDLSISEFADQLASQFYNVSKNWATIGNELYQAQDYLRGISKNVNSIGARGSEQKVDFNVQRVANQLNMYIFNVVHGLATHEANIGDLVAFLANMSSKLNKELSRFSPNATDFEIQMAIISALRGEVQRNNARFGQNLNVLFNALNQAEKRARLGELYQYEGKNFEYYRDDRIYNGRLYYDNRLNKVVVKWEGFAQPVLVENTDVLKPGIDKAREMKKIQEARNKFGSVIDEIANFISQRSTVSKEEIQKKLMDYLDNITKTKKNYSEDNNVRLMLLQEAKKILRGNTTVISEKTEQALNQLGYSGAERANIDQYRKNLENARRLKEEARENQNPGINEIFARVCADIFSGKFARFEQLYYQKILDSLNGLNVNLNEATIISKIKSTINQAWLAMGNIDMNVHTDFLNKVNQYQRSSEFESSSYEKVKKYFEELSKNSYKASDGYFKHDEYALNWRLHDALKNENKPELRYIKAMLTELRNKDYAMFQAVEQSHRYITPEWLSLILTVSSSNGKMHGDGRNVKFYFTGEAGLVGNEVIYVGNDGHIRVGEMVGGKIMEIQAGQSFDAQINGTSNKINVVEVNHKTGDVTYSFNENGKNRVVTEHKLSLREKLNSNE